MNGRSFRLQSLRFPVEAIRLVRFVRLLCILRTTLAATFKPAFLAPMPPAGSFRQLGTDWRSANGSIRSEICRRFIRSFLKRGWSILLFGLRRRTFAQPGACRISSQSNSGYSTKTARYPRHLPLIRAGSLTAWS